MSLKHQLTANTKLLQKASIIRQTATGKEVLLLKRDSQSLSRPSCWDLPGGNSEWPAPEQGSAADLHLQDIVREIEEETGLVAKVESFSLDKLTHLSTYFDKNKQVYTMICGWLLNFNDTDQKDIQISDEHQEYAWVAETDLDSYDFGGDKGIFIVDMIKTALKKF